MASAAGYLIGMLVGGVVGMFLLYSIWEFVLFRRIFSDPVKNKFSAAIAAYLTGATFAGLGNADGGSFDWSAYLQYLIPALIVGGLAVRRAIKLRSNMNTDAAIERAFG